jgi:hypothetical protein
MQEVHFQQLIKLLQENFSSFERKILPSSSLTKDLLLDVEDMEILFQKLYQVFRVDVSNFDIKKYYAYNGHERTYISHFLDITLPKFQRKYSTEKGLTVKDSLVFIQAKKITFKKRQLLLE